MILGLDLGSDVPESQVPEGDGSVRILVLVFGSALGERFPSTSWDEYWVKPEALLSHRLVRYCPVHFS